MFLHDIMWFLHVNFPKVVVVVARRTVHLSGVFFWIVGFITSVFSRLGWRPDWWWRRNGRRQILLHSNVIWTLQKLQRSSGVLFWASRARILSWMGQMPTTRPGLSWNHLCSRSFSNLHAPTENACYVKINVEMGVWVLLLVHPTPRHTHLDFSCVCVVYVSSATLAVSQNLQIFAHAIARGTHEG